MKKVFLFSLSLIFLTGIYSFAYAQKTPQQSLTVNNWLTSGPVTVNLPVFHNKNNLLGKSFRPADLLKFQQKYVSHIQAGEIFLTSSGKDIKWKEQNGNFQIPSLSNSRFALNWQAFYLQANQYLPLRLTVHSAQDFELFVNGKKKLFNYSANGKEAKKEVSLKIEPGKYLILIKSLYQKKDSTTWQLNASVSFDKSFPQQAVTLSTSDRQFLNLPHILLGKHLLSSSLSDDGSMIMLNYSEAYPPNGKTVKWFEIRKISDSQLIFSSIHSKLSNAQWIPNSHKISYVTKDGVSSALMSYDLNTHKEKVLMNKLKRFSGYQWDHDGSFLIFSTVEKRTKNTSGVYKVYGMPDRWPWYRTRTQLYLLKMSDLSVTPLTYGYLSNQLQDISPDNRRILFSQSFPYYSKRPYTKQIMMEMNLKSMKVDTLWNVSFGGNAIYSPDGTQLLVTGSPSMFHNAGSNLKKGRIPNDFDTQAYIYNLKDKKVTPITKNFKPALLGAYWNPLDKQIYFLATDRSYQDIWKYNPKTKQYHKLKVQVNVVNQFDFAGKNALMSYSGSSISHPSVAWVYNLKTSQQKEVANPEKAFFANIKFGKTENWNFVDKRGLTIEGRVYYPPNYNTNKKYPLIVYYYGGTVPTSRSFGGRYPMNLFASMGYIVYVLQPSGAIGFGQAFSALHVNGWGKENAQDIIEGTKKFIKSHPSVIPDDVGCLGASYGGYLTMFLQTKTDIFKTAVAHAGISSIASYWGMGYWGYLYSSVASANSFPWNNRKLYVNQSPLYNAEKIHTPMLLLQGTADTNVPTGESIQLYTALKLLGRQVTLVEIKGQNHHIVDYNKRILWQKTIFAWFAKYLKNQPQWWNAMYPHKDL